ncbi:MAG TPA: response regulator [Cyanobacteria bacterium UBA8553]|nr:response regulator [Cyanobacteria bacterium UBA8553]HAJ62548.1 response regulator [Cyanobacteria bacterium UBA8543]
MKPLILVIEDDDMMRSTLFEILELEDFNVVSAGDGLLGLRLGKEMQPDLIICDLNIPIINGYGVLQKLRENLTTADIPVIFLTSDSNPESRQRAMQLGVNSYLTKPVTISKLLETIKANTLVH